MFVTGRVADRGAARSTRCSRSVRARGRARHTTTRTSRSRCSGRSSRARRGRRTRDYVDERIIRPARADAHDVAAAGAEGAGLPRRRVRAHRVARAGDRSWPAPRRPASSGRRWRISAAGRRSSRAAPTACSTAKTRADVLPAGHVLPRRVGARAGGSGSMLYNNEGAIYARSRRRDGRPPRRRVREPEDRIGAAGLTNSGTRGDMDLIGDRARGEDGGALARAGRAVAARAGPRRRPSAARPVVVGGERVLVLVGGRRRCKARSSSAAPTGKGETDVRARRRRLDRRRRPRAGRAAADRRGPADLGRLRVHACAAAVPA